jgi:uncharacterized protein (DUF427 family)
MTLTLSEGPLSESPPETVNYRVDASGSRMLFQDFPRRVRAVLAGETLLDTRRGRLLHETGHLPVLYVPEDDLRSNLFEPSDHSTHCPHKGEAAYRSVQVDGAVAENAVWGYPEPITSAAWLRGYAAVEWDAMDAWFEEDEQIFGHVRDPYHRVDVRDASRHVRVLAAGEVVAETFRPKLLFETGFRPRYYIPPEDVRRDLLEASATRTICPYKGFASYWSLRLDDHRIADAAWGYEHPFEETVKMADHLCFIAEDLEVEVDGEPVEQ